MAPTCIYQRSVDVRLTDMTIDYSPEGVFTTFKGDEKGAAPVLTKLDLTFTEMEIMTKETIAIGH